MKLSKTLGDWVAEFFCIMSDMSPLLQIFLGGLALVAFLLAVEPDAAHEAERHGRVHAHIHQWAKNMHVKIDGTSCRFDGGSADCDIRTKDGKREQLRCDQTGCATRGP